MARRATRSLEAVSVRVVRLPHGTGLPLPAYQTAGAAGMDLAAAIAPNQTVVLEPGSRVLVPSGLMLELPRGLEAQVRPRSGLALRAGVTVLNSPGTIDSDYRGEVGVLLVNLGQQPFKIVRGERIAQLVIARVEQVRLVEAKTARATRRGSGGFGSTGMQAPAPRKPKPKAKKPKKPAAPKKPRKR